MAENSDYLKEQKEKEAKIAKEKELGIYKEKKPRGPVKKRQPIRANTADEAIEKMLEQKRISSKINYDVLKDLNVKPGASPRHQVETPKREPRITGRGVRTAACPLGVSKQVTLLGKRLQPFISGQPGKKLAVEKAAAAAPVPAAAAVVVESGPVAYDDAAAEDEDEDEEEEACVSAVDLLGSRDYGCDGDYDDGF